MSVGHDASDLFDSESDLNITLLRIEQGDKDAAIGLMARVAGQERAAQSFGRFMTEHDLGRYAKIRAMVPTVAAGMAHARDLANLLLMTQYLYVKAKARADRSRSNARFDAFWAEFDQLVCSHRCTSAES